MLTPFPRRIAKASNSLRSSHGDQRRPEGRGLASWARLRWAAPTALLAGACLVGLTGCPGKMEGAPAVQCELEDVAVRVHGAIAAPESMTKSAATGSANLLLTVRQFGSATCDGIYSITSSGGYAVHSARFDQFGAFDLDVTSTVFLGDEPQLFLELLIDANGNDSCDEGELVGSANIEQDGTLGPLTYSSSCPGYV